MGGFIVLFNFTSLFVVKKINLFFFKDYTPFFKKKRLYYIILLKKAIKNTNFKVIQDIFNQY